MTLSPHGLDTEERVFFYEQEFYVLSNFSAFRLRWKDIDFMTVEHAYHYEKFCFPHTEAVHYSARGIRYDIVTARSAHDAFQIAQNYKHLRRHDWDDVKVSIMRSLLIAKIDQHMYVRKKLLETGARELIENSWRDDFWGWGANHDGQNMLGKLWMSVRQELVETL